MINQGPKKGLTGNINYSVIQLAKIKSSEDINHSGRLKVWLLTSNTNENDEANWISVRYASPFAGITDPDKIDSGAIQSPEGTQKSYGFFAVPPDNENVVLVVFANADPKHGFWFASTYSDTMTKMIPSRAKGDTYQGYLPSHEVNRYSKQVESPEVEPIRPCITETSAFYEQELMDDPLLGPGKSTVRRDKSRSVMGWLSPGGNQVVLDDKYGYQLIRLRTASGVQLLLSETTGDVFINNKAGSGWIRVRNSGDVDLYSSKTFNVFSGETINLRSGGDINMEADGKINIKSEDITNVQSKTEINFKAPPWKIISSQITADVYSALSAGQSPIGPWNPINDPSKPAEKVTRTPIRGGKTV